MNIGSKISHKLILMVMIPLLGMAFFSLKISYDEYQAYGENSILRELITLTNKASDLVHELQTERGMTSSFLSSNGQAFAKEIQAQRANADAKLADYNAFIAQFDQTTVEPYVVTKIQKISEQLMQLNNIRQSVDQQSIKTEDAVSFYTHKNGLLLSLIGQLAAQSSNSHMAIMAAAFENFLQSKERAGVERAVLSNAFLNNRYAPGMADKFKTLVNEQNTYMDVFMEFAAQNQKDFYQKTLTGETTREVKRIRKIARENTRDFGIKASDWFDIMTQKINALKKVEDYIISDLAKYCDELIQSAKSTLLFSISLKLLGLLLSLALCIFVMRSIVTPIQQLQKTIEHAEQNHDLVTRIDTQSNDEIGQMATALNRMFDAFQNIISHVNRDTVQVATASQQLAAVTERNSNEIAQQHCETESLATAMNEMVATAQDIANHAQRAADSANEANHEAESGKELVSSTITSIHALAEEIDSASQAIAKVEQDSLEIGGILDVIRDIAEQTNLLALNAAIEAARAGEQGRGFAVVADEVRTLASRTQESTQDIQSMIEKLQNQTKAAVNIMINSQKQAETNVSHAEKAGQSLETITESVNVINEMNIQIASAAEEQTAVSDEINRNVINIKDSANHTMAGAQEITDASDSLEQLSNNLSALVKKFDV